jgi:hypothetical protein
MNDITTLNNKNHFERYKKTHPPPNINQKKKILKQSKNQVEFNRPKTVWLQHDIIKLY